MQLANRGRSNEAFVRVGRRHADVDDGDIRARGLDELEQPVGVAASPQTSIPASVSSRASPCRRSGVSSAITTRMGSRHDRVPPPGGLSTTSRPSSARPVGETAQTRPPGRLGAANAVVADLDDGRLRHVPDGDAGPLALTRIRDVRERLGDDEVGGGLDLRGKAILGRS